MNEQDIFLKNKIEKREKIDTIIAYVLIAILLVCIVLVLYLKFIRKEEETKPNVDVYVPNYISLNEISSSLNSSSLANEYISDGVTFNTSVSGNSIVVSYVKEDVNLNLNFPMVGNELMISVSDENNDIVTDIYKEIASIVCVYYGNEERFCKNTLDNMDDDGNDGIRFENDENNNNVYINTTKSFTVNKEIVYTDVTIVDTSVMDYQLKMLDVRVSNINVVSSDSNIVFSGNVERLTNDTSNVGILVKLYDVDGNVLKENKFEYNDGNVLNDNSTFNIEFVFDEVLKLENINKYSIEVIK